MPDITHDGLARIEEKNEADFGYARLGIELSGYLKIFLLEPQISFRKSWKKDVNFGRLIDQIPDSDIEKIIPEGKKLFMEECSKELKKEGLIIVNTSRRRCATRQAFNH